jgi:hypothetical protein
VLSIGIIGLLAARSLEGGHHDEHDAKSEQMVAKLDEHAASKDKKAHTSETSEKAEHQEENHGENHIMGEALGILGGLLLCIGHILNLREWKRVAASDGATATGSQC